SHRGVMLTLAAGACGARPEHVERKSCFQVESVAARHSVDTPASSAAGRAPQVGAAKVIRTSQLKVPRTPQEPLVQRCRLSVTNLVLMRIAHLYRKRSIRIGLLAG